MQLSWYIKRLSKMHLPEIPWRIWEKIKKQSDRIRRFRSPAVCLMPERSIFLLSKHAKSKCLNKYFSKSIQNHLSIADKALENHFSAFGINIAFKTHINWHTDPVTKQRWPGKFWGDIGYRNTNLGGAKFVWEINRLYFLFSLAISYRLTKDQKYADKILWIIKSWIEDNPYPIGVNWASGIEAGIRLANLVWALSFLGDYHFSKNNLKAINSFVWFHANHLQRYPSKFSSSNNHLIAEAFGLFISGLYFPHLNGAEKWLNTGKKILEKEITRQILPDGGSFECSTTYLSFVFDFFLLFKISCDINGIKYSNNIDERLEKSCEFIKSIMDKDGNIPNIGDQDSAVVVGFGLSNLDNFSSIINTGSLLFKRHNFTTGSPDFKTLILTGIGHYTKQENKADQRKDQWQYIHGHLKRQDKKNKSMEKCISKMHRQSGLVVIRDSIGKKEIVFTGNAMPLGMAPLYAHGHLDALSFTLSVDGTKFFVDSGTYLYHSGKKWRTYFRSTAAHNTLRINEKDLSEQTGDFMFGKPYKIIENSLENKENKIVWKASHDAYSKKRPFADIMREVTYDKDKKTFTIVDSIKQNKKNFIELFFHCHPQCSVDYSECDLGSTEKEFVIKKNHTVIKLVPDMSLKSEIVRGSLNPVLGWYSPSFNKIVETYVIRLYGSITNDGKITTAIIIQ